MKTRPEHRQNLAQHLRPANKRPAMMDLPAHTGLPEPHIHTTKRISPEPGRRIQVGSAHDPAEREADHAAEQVLRGGKANIARSHGASSSAAQSALQMKANGAATANATHAKGGMDAPASVEAGIQGKRGQGERLPAPILQKLAHTFTHDFSGVRVHTDHTAQDMNAQLRAKAFANGSDMFFGKGQYAPGTPEGDRLIAHEAAHVVQQHQGGERIDKQDLIQLDRLPSSQAGDLAVDAPQNQAPTMSFSEWLKTHKSVIESLENPSSMIMIELVATPGKGGFEQLSYFVQAFFDRKVFQDNINWHPARPLSGHTKVTQGSKSAYIKIIVKPIHG